MASRTVMMMLVATAMLYVVSGQGEDVYIRVLHGVPKAPAVDVYLNGAKAISSLAFTSITDYTKVPEGDYAVKVNVAGTDTTVLEAKVPLSSRVFKYYTIIAENVKGDLNNITAAVVPGPELPPLKDTECATRFVHLVPDAPAVSVWVNGKIDLPHVSYDHVEPARHVEVGAGHAQVALSVAGSNPPKVVANGTITCAGGKYETIAAMGSVTGTGKEGLQFVVLDDNTPH